MSVVLADLFEYKKVKVKDLKEWEDNPRFHTKSGLVSLKESIKSIGFGRFMFVDKDLTIVGGHARKKILIDIGVDEIEVKIAKKKLSKSNFKKVALLTNQIWSCFNYEELNDNIKAEDLLSFGLSSRVVDLEEENFGSDSIGGFIKKISILFKFDSEEDRDLMSEIMILLTKKYPNKDNDTERFIEFLKDVL